MKVNVPSLEKESFKSSSESPKAVGLKEGPTKAYHN